MVPAKVTLPYSIAKPIVSPAPNAKMTGFKNISSKAVKINEIIIVITRVHCSIVHPFLVFSTYATRWLRLHLHLCHWIGQLVSCKRCYKSYGCQSISTQSRDPNGIHQVVGRCQYHGYNKWT